MLENIIVGIIILAAAVFAGYRLFFRPSCGCGSDCGCSKGSGSCSGSDKKPQNGNSGCNCGK